MFFLWGMTQGLLDPAFAIPAGVGDILIGVTAIPFAIFLWKGYSWSKYGVVVWSVLGIADLVNAVTRPNYVFRSYNFNNAKLSFDPFSYHASACSFSFTPNHTVSAKMVRADTRAH